jgi:outer membrane lipoprotein-sorting protein
MRVTVCALTLTAATWLVAVPAAAQTAAACQPIFDGMTKQIVTPNHSFIAMTGGSTMTTESITTGGVMYIQVNGKWMRSPTSPSDLQQLQQQDVKKTTTSCQRLPDETVNGTGTVAMVFHVQNKGPASTSDGKVWLAKGTGLPIRGEEDVLSGSTKTHISTRIEYTNIQPPPGIK